METVGKREAKLMKRRYIYARVILLETLNCWWKSSYLIRAFRQLDNIDANFFHFRIMPIVNKFYGLFVHWISQWSKLLMYCNINLLLTEREGPTGEYWPEVVTEKTTEGQYSPVRPEQARLVSSLLYGTLFLIVKCSSGGLHLKNVPLLHPSLKFRKKFNLFSFCC